MVRICEPCVYRCHRGHKGVRLVRISPIACQCGSVCEAVNHCCAHEMSAIQLQNIKMAQHQAVEEERSKLYNLLMPPIFALVPKYSLNGIFKRESGYMMCRRPPPNNALLKHIVTCRSFTTSDSEELEIPSTVTPSDHLISPNDVEDQSGIEGEPSVVSVTDSQTASSIPPSLPPETQSTEKDSPAGYISELENNIIGNVYLDDRQLAPIINRPKSTAEIIAYLNDNPQLLISDDELSNTLLQQGWISVMDSEEPFEYQPGCKVLCTSRRNEIPCYGTIVKYLMNGVYLVRFYDGTEEKHSYEAIESVIRQKFYYNTITGHSAWKLPRDGVVTETYGQPPEHLEFSGKIFFNTIFEYM